MLEMSSKSTILAFMKTLAKQQQKGLDKYGKPVNPLDDYDWLDMAAEEHVDAFVYLQAEKIKRETLVAEIRDLVRERCSESDFVEINKMLLKLEGVT